MEYVTEESVKEENAEEYSSYSELIVGGIIEKLISLTISQSYRNEINNKINPFCFDFIKQSLSSMVHTSYIFFERDDKELEFIYKRKASLEESFVNSPSDEIFFDNKFFGCNEWSEILEPNRPKIDRAASTLIKVLKSNNNNISITHNLNLDNNQKNNDNVIMETKSNASFAQQMNPGIMNPMSVGNIATQGNIRTQQNAAAKNKITELEQWEIPDLQNIVEDDAIIHLREEKAKEWKKKDEDVKIKQIADREKNVVRVDNKRGEKEVDGKKVTFDVEGNAVNIKNVQFEKLYSDFALPKFDIRDKGEFSNVAIKTDKSDNNTANTKNATNSNLIKIDGRSDIASKKGTIRISQAVIPVKYPNDSNKPGYMSNYLNSMPERNPVIQPAGSNYDLITPDTGVTIIEGTKKKSGDKDFFRKFSKYSVYDYNSILKDSTSANNLSVQNMVRRGNTLNNDELNHNQLSLPYVHATKPELNSFNGVYGYGNNSLMMSQNYSTKGKFNNSITLMDSMKLSNKLTMSLKTTLDALDLIPEFEERLYEENEKIHNYGGEILNNIRLGKDQGEHENKKDALESINQFNYSIIKNSKWGNGLAGTSKNNSTVSYRNYKARNKDKMTNSKIRDKGII